LGLKPPSRSHRIGLGGDVALLHRFRIGDERRRVEGVGNALRRVETELGDHPLEIGLEARVAEDELICVLQVFPGVHPLPGMASSAPAALSGNARRRPSAECSARRQRRPAACCRPCGSRILPASSSGRLFTCGPPWAIVDLEAAGLVGAVGDRLIVAAMLGLGEPVGAEGHRFLGRGLCTCGHQNCCRSAGSKKIRHVHHPLVYARNCFANPRR
jgi:hypothetical protein